MKTRLFTFIILLGSTASLCGQARAQILFEDIRPQTTPTMNGSIGKKSIHMAPIEPMAKPSKSSIPMTKFKDHVIRPDRIMMEPIERNSLKKEQIRTDQITFNPMTQTNIKPQSIQMTTLIPTLPNGKANVQKVSMPPPQKPHWAFNPTLQGHDQATTQFDSSVKAPMRDYDSPYYPDVPATASHPMAW